MGEDWESSKGKPTGEQINSNLAILTVLQPSQWFAGYLSANQAGFDVLVMNISWCFDKHSNWGEKRKKFLVFLLFFFSFVYVWKQQMESYRMDCGEMYVQKLRIKVIEKSSA